MTRDAIPILPDPAQLAGDWIVSAHGRSARINLSTEPATMDGPGAPAWVFEPPGALASFGLGAAVAWRPAPDGIALVAASGSTVAFFSAEGGPDRYVYRTQQGGLTVLTRTAGQAAFP